MYIHTSYIYTYMYIYIHMYIHMYTHAYTYVTVHLIVMFLILHIHHPHIRMTYELICNRYMYAYILRTSVRY